MFVLIVLAHHRRRLVHFNVTEHPTAMWTAEQMIQAFPNGTAPRFLVRDRDRILGEEFRERVKAIGIEEILMAPRSPWQNPFAERMIRTLRQDCLDHIVFLGESHLRIILKKYLSYYHRARTHLALEKYAPEPRQIQALEHGHVIEIPEVGSLHHRYERRAA